MNYRVWGITTQYETARSTDFDGVKCRVLDIPTLIQAKSHANRRKDLQAVAELKVIQQRIEKSKHPQ